MKYLIILFLSINMFANGQTCDTIVECNGNIKTTTIVIENDTLFHLDQSDSLVHEVIIEKVIEISRDVIRAVKQKDYGRIAVSISILLFIGCCVYKRRKKCGEKKN